MQDNLNSELAGLKIGFAITGSYCTLAQTVGILRNLKSIGADIFPIISYSIRDYDTKFGAAAHWRQEISDICERPVIDSIVLAEPIGPQSLLDVLVLSPCSGNTLAKLANGITDTPVLMSAKAHLRNLKPLILSVSTNDGLGINAKNLGLLLNMKNIYFVPFGQDSPDKKPNSLCADLSKLPETVLYALKGRQFQPVLISY